MRTGLTPRDLQGARFRCLEEVELDPGLRVRRLASQVAHRFRPAVGQAVGGNDRAGRAQHRASQKAALASTFGPALRRHIKELQQARQTYGPMRLSEV